MAIQTEEVLWGELRELPVAATFAQYLWPHSTVYRMESTATIDFAVVANGAVKAYVEVKVRRTASTDFPTTVVHEDKHSAGRFNLKFHKVHTYCAILFSDTFGWFPLAESPDERLKLARYGTEVPHVGYNMSRLKFSSVLFTEMQEKIGQLVAGATTTTV